MQLVPARYRTLGLPPSLQSCTRDHFPAVAAAPPLRTAQGLSILRGIAGAAAHVHERGVAHGDLYAHNILFDADGTALLGDFGAAAMTGSLDAAQSLALRRLEVRAFGCLLEELAERCDAAGPLPDALQALATRCLQPDVAARPSFCDLEAALAGTSA